jgi:serine/threonine protein kinase
VVEKLLTRTPISEVYLVYDKNKYEQYGTKYSAVLKVSVPDPNQLNINALHNEMEILYRLNHPSVVRIYPLGEYKHKIRYLLYQSSDSAYIALEHITGGSLVDHLKTILHEPYDFLWRMELFYQMVCAVDYLHQRGFAHLDLKLENFLVRSTLDPYRIPLPVLIDFGSASLADQLVDVRRIAGKIAAPELLEGLEHPIRLAREPLIPQYCDSWSLGAVLYELLTGYSIGWAGNPNYPHISFPISEIVKEVPSAIDRLFTRMTFAEPQRRMTSTHILEALQDIISDTQPPRISTP